MGYFWAVPGFFTDKLGALYMFFTVRPNFSSIYGINAGNMGVFYWYFTFYRYFTGYFRDCFPSGVPAFRMLKLNKFASIDHFYCFLEHPRHPRLFKKIRNIGKWGPWIQILRHWWPLRSFGGCHGLRGHQVCDLCCDRSLSIWRTIIELKGN